LLRSASAVQLLRSLEVWFVLIASHVMNIEYSINSQKIVGLLLMTLSNFIGKAFVSRDAGILMLATNMAMPVRNIGLKFTLSKIGADSITGDFSNLLRAIQIVCLIYGAFCCFLCKDMYGLFKAYPLSISASVSFGAIYNLSSINFLYKKGVTVVDHAAFSLAKRLTMLVYATVVDFDLSLAMNTSVMCFGQILYFIKASVINFIHESHLRIFGINLLLFVILLFESLQTPMHSVAGNKDMMTRSRRTFHCIWMYPDAMGDFQLELMKKMACEHQIVLYCATTDCVQTKLNVEVEGYRNCKINFRTSRVNLTELTQGTPLDTFVQHHIYFRLKFGKFFSDFIQDLAVILVGLHAFPEDVVVDFSIMDEELLQLIGLKEQGARWAYVSSSSSTCIVAAVATDTESIRYIQLAYAALLPAIPSGSESWAREKLDEPAKYSPRERVLSLSQIRSDICSKLKRLSIEVVKLPRSYRRTVNQTSSYGILTFDKRCSRKHGTCNSGDEMQVLAGTQFLPQISQSIERDELGKFNGHRGGTTFFLNAWYGAHSMWPPGTGIDPIITSVHFENAMNVRQDQTAEYLRMYIQKYGAIGARDLHTLKIFAQNNISAFFSACATLSLPNPLVSSSISRSGVIIVDIATNGRDIVPKEVQEKAEIFSQSVQAEYLKRSRSDRFDIAYAHLLIYARAKLVITSRIHVALPCVAVGTPVVFIPGTKLPGGSTSRVEGLLDMFHSVNSSTTFDWINPPPNPNAWKRELYRAAFWHSVGTHSKILTDTALLFGVNPFFASKLLTKERKWGWSNASTCKAKLALALRSKLKIKQMEFSDSRIIDHICLN